MIFYLLYLSIISSSNQNPDEKRQLKLQLDKIIDEIKTQEKVIKIDDDLLI